MISPLWSLDGGRKGLSAGHSGVPQGRRLGPNLFGHLADLVMIPVGKSVSSGHGPRGRDAQSETCLE